MQSALLVILAVTGVAVCVPSVLTVAGGANIANFVDAFGTAARFSTPIDVAGDSQGNLHIAERGNQRLRKLDITTGQVTTRFNAGSTLSSVSNMDPSGNVYFGEDAGSRRIWKITSGGTVTVLGSYSWYQYGMWFNPVDGFLYSTGHGINQILKVNVNNGAFSIYAGSTTGQNSHNVYRTSAQYSSTLGCGGADNGDFYFTQFTSYVANKINYATGMSTLVAGTVNSGGYNGDGPALTRTFSYCYALDVSADSQHVYIADSNNNRIRRVTAGYVTTVAGSGAGSTVDGPALSATMNFPWGVSAHAAGKVYWVEYGGQVVRVLTEQVHSGSANYCCQPFYDECTAIHAGCNSLNLTPLQNACQASASLCGVYNLAVAVKNSCNRLATECDALIAAC